MPYTRCTLVTTSGEHVADVPMARNETVYDAITRSAHPLRTRCRGSVICGLCRVVVVEGGGALEQALPDERQLLGDDEAQNMRLACRIRLPRSLRRLVVATPYWRAGERPANESG